MPTFAVYRPAERGLPAPSGLSIAIADQRHADGIARLYSDREEATTEQAKAWAQRMLGRISERWCVVVAETGERVVGYGVAGWLEPEVAPNGFYLLGVVVAPEFRHRGIAHALTRRRIDWLRERTENAFYFANASNRATIDLHRTFGLRELNQVSEIAGATFDGGEGALYEARFPIGS